jgi:hypothetical protein
MVWILADLLDCPEIIEQKCVGGQKQEGGTKSKAKHGVCCERG